MHHWYVCQRWGKTSETGVFACILWPFRVGFWWILCLSRDLASLAQRALKCRIWLIIYFLGESIAYCIDLIFQLFQFQLAFFDTPNSMIIYINIYISISYIIYKEEFCLRFINWNWNNWNSRNNWYIQGDSGPDSLCRSQWKE